jgi:hypothetical protein
MGSADQDLQTRSRFYVLNSDIAIEIVWRAHYVIGIASLHYDRVKLLATS